MILVLFYFQPDSFLFVFFENESWVFSSYAKLAAKCSTFHLVTAVSAVTINLRSA